MAIVKGKIDSHFSVIPNSTLQDSNLSFEATGLLAMMLSLPDDWVIHKSWLQQQKVKCGRDKLTSMMNELINAGYVIKKIKQNDDGKLNGVDWEVYPTVQLKNRQTVNPSDGKSDTTKETNIKNKQDKNINVPTKVGTSKKIEYPSEFEWLWANKPNREGGNPKKQAFSACKARLKEGTTWREMAEGLKRYKAYCEAKGLINTPMVQQMSTFFGTKESFKELWSINNAANQQATTSTGRRLTAEEERNQELLRKYGNTASPSGWSNNTTTDSRMDQYEIQRGISSEVEQEVFTIDLDSGDWSSNC